jgi:hypothetical protein
MKAKTQKSPAGETSPASVHLRRATSNVLSSIDEGALRRGGRSGQGDGSRQAVIAKSAATKQSILRRWNAALRSQ